MTNPAARIRVNGGEAREVVGTVEPDGRVVYVLPDVGAVAGDTITIESVLVADVPPIVVTAPLSPYDEERRWHGFTMPTTTPVPRS